jgi:aspartyl-tRNA(Asn)/glutamyl-tRNA(Gln) amidotransferase subunit C
MDIDNKLIDHLCFLGRISLAPADKEQLKQDLSKILSYIETLKQVDVAGIEPLVHPAPACSLEDIPEGDVSRMVDEASQKVGRGWVHSLGEVTVSNIFREDQSGHNSLEQNKALQNAPKRRANFFEVPRVIE